MSLFAIIMAGGAGTRLWPASRARLPKQFLQITGDRSMCEQTLARLEPAVGHDSIYVVVNRPHEAITRTLLDRLNVHVLIEPVGRNTAACIGLAALHIFQRSDTAPILALPADHFVAHAERFAALVRAAAQLARSGGIVTLGIPPTRPDSGYGYIEVGETGGEALGEPYFRVTRFVEKPDSQTALGYVASGRYLWNSGIFAFTARTILGEIDRWMPGLAQGLQQIQRAIGSAEYDSVLERVYSTLDSLSIDRGVMERTAAPVYVLRADFGWSDVGSWQALYELCSDRHDEAGNLPFCDAVVIDSKRNLLYSDTQRVISLLGVEGLVVVDAGDAVLVADMRRAQEITGLPEILRRRGRQDRC